MPTFNPLKVGEKVEVVVFGEDGCEEVRRLVPPGKDPSTVVALIKCLVREAEQIDAEKEDLGVFAVNVDVATSGVAYALAMWLEDEGLYAGATHFLVGELCIEI